MQKSPWWNDADSKTVNVIRFIDYVMQDDECNFLSILARAEQNYELSAAELAEVTAHFTAQWLRDNSR